MAQGAEREGKWRGNWRIEWVASTLHTTSELGVSSITTADVTPRLPVVDWIDDPADLNGLVHFAERRKLVSARVPSLFKRSLVVTAAVAAAVAPFITRPTCISNVYRIREVPGYTKAFSSFLYSIWGTWVAYFRLRDGQRRSLVSIPGVGQRFFLSLKRIYRVCCPPTLLLGVYWWSFPRG